MTFQLYNSITKRLEPLVPADPDAITFYTCGPTVYDDAHIGNFRSFLAADLLRRWLESPLCTLLDDQGNEHTPTKESPRTVTHVMNITDVGHMTDDDNADGGGEDKMEIAAQRLLTKQLESKKSGDKHAAANINPSDPRAIARFYEQRFKEDAIALGLKVAVEDRDRKPNDPVVMPRASDHIDHMKQVITNLLNNNHAYAAGTPGSRAVYFNTQTFPNYGQLSGNTLNKLQGGAGGRVDESQQSEKKHPADFLLWKEDATHTMKWPAPDHPDCNGWNEGYPGWHIECTAMALARLVPGGLEAAAAKHSTIDLHSGGEDNIFPHHECEIAQSCCFTHHNHPEESTFARHWFHARFLKVEGQKMSKSKGTMYTLRDLTDKGIDPAAVRLELIKTHYRANADFSMQGLADSKRMIDRWRKLAKDIMAIVQIEPKDADLTAFDYSTAFNYVIHKQIDEFASALSNDLNVAKAIGIFVQSQTVTSHQHDPLYQQIDKISEKIELPTSPMESGKAFEIMKSKESEITPNKRSLAALHLIDNILGVIFRPVESNTKTQIAEYQPGVTPSEEIEALLQQRADAKKAKDFAAADAIRDQLAAMNLTIMDKPAGKVEVAPAN